MRISRLFYVAAISVLAVGWPIAPASAQSDGTLLCDGTGTAVSKPVAGQQWSIQYNPLQNAANGTVYDPVDQSVRFVSCFRTAMTGLSFTFDCASPSADDPDEWETFAEGVSLDPDFFRLSSFYRVPELSALLSARFRIGTDAAEAGDGSRFFDWQADDALDGDVLRGTNLRTGNPFVIQATYGNDRPGTGPANYFATEFADGRCDNFLFNIQLLPDPAGEETSKGVVTGTGFSTGRDGAGLCLSPTGTPGTWGGAGVVGVLRTTFRFSVIPPVRGEIAPLGE